MAKTSGTAKIRAMPLSFWINIGLSFAFVVIGVTFVLWSAFWKFGRDWVSEELISTVGWGVLAVGLVLGVANAVRYYRRVMAKSPEG